MEIVEKLVPIISESKNYWLVRTQGGRYYNEYRKKGCIAINWDEITLEDIQNLSREELEEKISTCYPDKKKPGRAAGQLKTFVNEIKKGDAVVITSYASNKFYIGEVLEDECFYEIISQKELEENVKLCPFQKRKKVKWIKEVHKWDVEMSMFKLLQHAQNTISDANDYADIIESMVHDFYIKGNKAEITIRVKREGNIPWDSFFSMGMEITELAREFQKFSKTDINIDAIDTKININSPGKFKLTGPIITISAIGFILVSLTGGGVNVQLPEKVGGGFELHMNSLLREVTDFLDHKEARDQKELMLKKYMDQLEVKTPDELTKIINSVDVSPVQTEKVEK
jgi:restriction system protein